MNAKQSRQFRDVLNSMPPRERFKMQTEFATSKNPVAFAALMVQARGKNNNA